jgi:hypothetical protein
LFGVHSFSMGLVVLPVSFVDICVGVDESSPSIGPVVEPIALVEGVVFPDLFAPAVAHAVAELSDVPDSVAHVDRSLGDKVVVFFLIKLEGPETGSDGLGLFVVEVFWL